MKRRNVLKIGLGIFSGIPLFRGSSKAAEDQVKLDAIEAACRHFESCYVLDWEMFGGSRGARGLLEASESLYLYLPDERKARIHAWREQREPLIQRMWQGDWKNFSEAELDVLGWDYEGIVYDLQFVVRGLDWWLTKVRT